MPVWVNWKLEERDGKKTNNPLGVRHVPRGAFLFAKNLQKIS
jgi:hypothetical protein